MIPGLFTSKRERWFWVAAAVVLAGIFSTLWLAGLLAEVYGEELQAFLGNVFLTIFLGTIIWGIWFGWNKPKRETATLLVIAVVYLMVFLRMTVSMTERTHLFEYGIVAVLIHQALLEGKRNGRVIAVPAIYAIVLTALIGTLDECVQAVLPNRVFDPIDIGVNALAGFMGVAAISTFTWVRHRFTSPGDLS